MSANTLAAIRWELANDSNGVDIAAPSGQNYLADLPNTLCLFDTIALSNLQLIPLKVYKKQSLVLITTQPILFN